MSTRRSVRLARRLIAFGAAISATSPSALSAQTHYEYLAWTPDSRGLAVSVDGDVYSLPLDGGPAVRLTTSAGRDVFAAWSPDGSTLLFASDRNGDQEIFMAEPDGSDPRPLTDNDVDDSWPAWSPDARQIAFMRRDGEHWHIWIMHADGSGERRLVDAPGHEFNPAWSPDGRWILFEASRDGSGNGDLYVIRPDGSGERRLTETPANDVYPDWSPDGSSIAYCTIDAGRAFIHIMPAEGGTPSLWREDACLAKWSSDGEHLAYVSSARGRPERLWVAGIDGSDVTEIPSVGQRSVELRDE